MSNERKDTGATPCECPMRDALEEIDRAMIGTHENSLDYIVRLKMLAREALAAPCPLEAERDRLCSERDEAQGLLASCTDLANSWARELGIAEAHSEAGLQVLIDKLWGETSSRLRVQWKR